MTLSWPNHVLTLADWEALPESNELRVELVEGVLAVVPQPYSWHQHAGNRITHRTTDQLPPELIALGEVDVIITDPPLTIRSPDMIVTRTALFDTNPPRYGASDLLLATEILSAGTRRVDRMVTFSEYAEAGIPQYWIVDLDRPTTLLAYVLVGGSYELSGEHTGTAALDVARHPVTLDLDALTRR